MYVYFIQSGKDGAIKIGKSNYPEKRIGELQTGSPHELFMIGTIHCETEKEALSLEKTIHENFKHKRVSREWFESDIQLNTIPGINDGWSGVKTVNGRRVGRPLIDINLKKIPVSYRLPRWMVKWMRDHKNVSSKLIEDAMKAHYDIVEPNGDE